jgi:hypothetical protein
LCAVFELVRFKKVSPCLSANPFLPCLDNTAGVSLNTLVNTPRGNNRRSVGENTCWCGWLVRRARALLPADPAEDRASGDGADPRAFRYCYPVPLSYASLRRPVASRHRHGGACLAQAPLFFVFTIDPQEACRRLVGWTTRGHRPDDGTLSSLGKEESSTTAQTASNWTEGRHRRRRRFVLVVLVTPRGRF